MAVERREARADRRRARRGGLLHRRRPRRPLHAREDEADADRRRGRRKVSPYFIPGIIANLAAGQVSMAHGLKGPSYCTTSACSSGAHAIGEATEWIRRGHARRHGRRRRRGDDHARRHRRLRGDVRALASATTTRRTRAARSTRAATASSAARARASSCSSRSRARRSAARSIYAEITGYGASSDAYHLTQPAPERRGRAARDAHGARGREASRPTPIDYINAHGTSTPVGDIEESKAIAAVFGAHATDKKLWVSSTKSMMGHLLGAAGAVESAICALAIARRATSRPRSTSTIRTRSAPSTTSPTRHASGASGTRMNNSFGFGGTNCSLVFSRFEG